MSEYDCPYCRGYSSTGGFVHEPWCPVGGSVYRLNIQTPCPNCEKLQSEISRLKAALEKAERERDSNKFLLGVYKGGFASGRSERDEARRWAFSLLRLAEYWRGRSCNGL